jgi:hypothetical protein
MDFLLQGRRRRGGIARTRCHASPDFSPRGHGNTQQRVSTSEQTLDHQLTQARHGGYVIDDDNVIADHGVSGVSTNLFERENASCCSSSFAGATCSSSAGWTGSAAIIAT